MFWFKSFRQNKSSTKKEHGLPPWELTRVNVHPLHWTEKRSDRIWASTEPAAGLPRAPRPREAAAPLFWEPFSTCRAQGWNVLQTICGNLVPKCDGLKVRPWGRDQVIGWSLTSGIRALVTEKPQRAPCWEPKSALTSTESAGAFVLDFPASRTVTKKLPLFISHPVYSILLQLPEQNKAEWFISKKLLNFSPYNSVTQVSVLTPTHPESLLSFNFITLFIQHLKQSTLY